MKKIVLSSICAIAFLACGGGKGDNWEEFPDAAPVAERCNPYEQTGCEAGEKCAQLTIKDGDPGTNAGYLGRVACVADGTVALGAACVDGPAGEETGFDNCASGGVCVGGLCSAVCLHPSQEAPDQDTCRVAGQTTVEGSYCTSLDNTFTEDNNIGACISACDPVATAVVDGNVTTDQCPTGEACVLQIDAGICAPVPNERTQNVPCVGPAEGRCFLNGCSPGFGSFLPPEATLDLMEKRTNGVLCARYCTPVDSYLGAAEKTAGDLENCTTENLAALGGVNGYNVDHECRFSNGFLRYTNVPDWAGHCVPVTTIGGEEYGSCATFEWTGMKDAYLAALNAEGGTEETAFAAVDSFCGIGAELPEEERVLDLKCYGYYMGCISLPTVDAGFPPAPAAARAGRPAFERWEQRFGAKYQETTQKMSLDIMSTDI